MPTLADPVTIETSVEPHPGPVMALRRGGDLVMLTLGAAFTLLGSVFATLGCGGLIVGFEGPVIAPIVFALSGLAAVAMGSWLLFGRKTITIDADRRVVTRETRWLRHRSITEMPFDDFHGVGIGMVRSSGEHSAGHLSYIVELRGTVDLALPLSACRLDDVVEHALRVGGLMGLGVDTTPRNTTAGFFRWASGRWTS